MVVKKFLIGFQGLNFLMYAFFACCPNFTHVTSFLYAITGQKNTELFCTKDQGSERRGSKSGISGVGEATTRILCDNVFV